MLLLLNFIDEITKMTFFHSYKAMKLIKNFKSLRKVEMLSALKGIEREIYKLLFSIENNTIHR